MTVSTLKVGEEADAGNVVMGICARNGGRQMDRESKSCGVGTESKCRLGPDELRKGVKCFESRWSFNYYFSIVCSGRNGERAAINMIFEKDMLFWMMVHFGEMPPSRASS